LTSISPRCHRQPGDPEYKDEAALFPGVTYPEKLTLIVSHNESHLGDIRGKMIFDRKKYGMNKGIPFISIADHVKINVHQDKCPP
jgi:hypothetical protein